MNDLEQLEQRMNKDKPLLAILVHQSFLKIKKGYIGFMITRGLWYKLRVYNYEGNKADYCETLTYESAYSIMEIIKQQIVEINLQQ